MGLRFSLEHEGYKTYTASNGLEAMEELRKHHPMLMVLDLMMPEMDGWAVLELTKLPEEQRPRIMIVSALTGPDDKAKATLSGPMRSSPSRSTSRSSSASSANSRRPRSPPAHSILP